ncbi:WD40 repeat-like protein, partial [Aureobasidium melanogenum]
MDLDDDNRVMSLDRPLSPMPSRMMTIDPDQLAGRSYNGRPAAIDQENDGQFPAPQDASRSTRTRHSVSQPRPKRLSTSTKAGIPLNILPSAPASPPTPAPSPTPYQRAPSWNTAGENEDAFLRDAREHFSNLDASGRERFLAEFLNMCDSHLLSFVHHFVSPRLKKDPFEHLPDELCLRASQGPYVYNNRSPKRNLDGSIIGPSSSAPNLSLLNQDQDSASPRSKKRQSHYSHFRHKYMIEAAWRKGGESIIKHITPDQGVVTSLHLTDKYIVVAMDNAKIHVFNTVGEHQKTLKGHVMGVWAMVPWDDILVSGGCDRDVRVWDMSTGKSIHTLRGHTSTVRCLKMSDANTAISGSRDTTLRVWDLTTGMCKNVLVGHQASVRCLAIHGDLVVSGSYDTTARIWSISEGRCLRTLTGHFSQIYAIAFDGNRIATGSLDTSVRIWDPKTGMCTAILQGHTSLVGQLQMRGDTLVTGGSDGSVRVWSLQTNTPIHRLAAHDNSVTSLQFDDHRILVRELSQPAEAVWRVAFEEEKAVIMASRSNRTVMEVWSFSPPEEPWERRSESPLSLPERISAAAHDDKDDDERTAGRPEKQSSGDVDATMSDV